ncbi:MAG: biotin--[acetyl-CoA-carboxylase] ligase [Myxococcales bacterium]|nr:biotin--[acetyl-CoA-carboxylase] ligase [Myxococcales bacterium]
MRLDAERLRAALDPAPTVLTTTPSTNDALRALASEGAPHGSVVLAEHQTAGRGRLGRHWESAPGANLLMSLLVRRPLPAAKVPLLCLAAAVGVAAAAGPSFRIKWPNDVLAADGRKVAGILAEAEWGAQGMSYAILGVGINVGEAPPLATAASLAEVSGDRDRTELAIEVVRAVLQQTDLVDRAPADMLAAWRARSATLGRAVAVGEISGVAIDIDPDGALRVRDASGAEHRVLTGDVDMVAGRCP